MDTAATAAAAAATCTFYSRNDTINPKLTLNIVETAVNDGAACGVQNGVQN